MAGEARKAAAQKAIDLMLDTRGSISRAARLEKMEAIFAEYADETREQCAQIAESSQKTIPFSVWNWQRKRSWL